MGLNADGSTWQRLGVTCSSPYSTRACRLDSNGLTLCNILSPYPCAISVIATYLKSDTKCDGR